MLPDLHAISARISCMWFVFVRGELHGSPQRSRRGPAMAAPRTPPHPQPLLSHTLASHCHLSLHSPAFAPGQLPPPTRRRRRRRWGKEVRERYEHVRPLSQSVVVRLIILHRVPRRRRNGEFLLLFAQCGAGWRCSPVVRVVLAGADWLGRIVACCGAGANLMRVWFATDLGGNANALLNRFSNYFRNSSTPRWYLKCPNFHCRGPKLI